MRLIYYLGSWTLWGSSAAGVAEAVWGQEATRDGGITATLLAAASGAFALIFWIVREQFRANSLMQETLRENTRAMQSMIDRCPVAKAPQEGPGT